MFGGDVECKVVRAQKQQDKKQQAALLLYRHVCYNRSFKQSDRCWYVVSYRLDTQISTYHSSDTLAKRANSRVAILRPSHNEPQARQCRVIIPLVNDVLRTHVFCFHSQAPATSLPLAGVLRPASDLCLLFQAVRSSRLSFHGMSRNTWRGIFDTWFLHRLSHDRTKLFPIILIINQVVKQTYSTGRSTVLLVLPTNCYQALRSAPLYQLTTTISRAGSSTLRCTSPSDCLRDESLTQSPSWNSD